MEIVKPRTVGSVEQQPKFIQMLIHVLRQLQRAAVGILRHVRGLRGAIHLAEFLLYLEEVLRHFVQHRLHDGGKQPFLVAEANINEVGAGARRRCDGAKGSARKPLIQKFAAGTRQYALRNTLNLLRHSLSSIGNTVMKRRYSL